MKNPTPITLNGLSGPLAALAFGDPDHPPVLALHGWLDNANSFTPLSGYLDQHYVVALDFAGHGLSGHRPPGVVYHHTDYIADVAHALADLGWQRFSLMGHSLGAGVGMVYASVFPQQIDKLVLIDGTGPLSGAIDGVVDQLRKSVAKGLESGVAKGEKPKKTYDNWQILIKARASASPISEDAAELLVRRNADEQDGAITLRSDSRLRHPSPIYLTEDMVLRFISGVAAPTLLILADDGMVVNRPTTEARIAAFKQISVVSCAGQHHVHMDHPEKVVGHISNFLSPCIHPG